MRWRQHGVGGVITAWGCHSGVELALCPCRRTLLSPCQGIFLVGGVVVDSVKEHC